MVGQTIVSGLRKCSKMEWYLRQVGLVASATLQVRWLPASVEVVVICAVATIADSGAVSVLSIDIVVTTLGGGKDLAVLAASRRHGIGLGACVVNHSWQLSAARIDEPV